MQDNKKLRDRILTEIKNALVGLLESSTVTIDESAAVARETLNSFPSGSTSEQLLASLIQMKQKFPKQERVFAMVEGTILWEQKREAIESEIFPLINQGDIKSALDKVKPLI